MEPSHGSRILAGNAFTPYGMLAYAGSSAISIQAHPEFGTGYAAGLIAGHRPAVPLDEGLRAGRSHRFGAGATRTVSKAGYAAFWRAPDRAMVRFPGGESNQVFDTLAEWETILRDTSLARPKPPSL